MVCSLRLRDGNSLREGYDKAGPTRYPRVAMSTRRPSSSRQRPRAARTARASYAPAARLHEVRALLDRAEGTSIYDIAGRFGRPQDLHPRALHAAGLQEGALSRWLQPSAPGDPDLRAGWISRGGVAARRQLRVSRRLSPRVADRGRVRPDPRRADPRARGLRRQGRPLRPAPAMAPEPALPPRPRRRRRADHGRARHRGAYQLGAWVRRQGRGDRASRAARQRRRRVDARGGGVRQNAENAKVGRVIASPLAALASWRGGSTMARSARYAARRASSARARRSRR